LVRGKSPEEAEQRVIHLTKFYFDEAFYEMYRSRIHIVNGDLGLDRFGLSGEEYNRLSGEIDCIINSAAFVKYYGHYEDFVRVNVDGVRRMIEFALTGKKKDLNHISTMNVVLGEFKDKEFVLCTEFYQNLEQDINEFSYYLQTKYKGEKLVADARAKGLNASVYRVGNLVFESATGKFQENIEDNDFYTRIKSFVKLGVMVDSDIPVLNFTFVDQASKAIVLLHDQENLRGETHHLFNSNRVSLNQLTEMLREVGESLRTISLLEFIDILKNNYDNPDLRQYIEKIILLTGVFTDPVGTVITQTTEKTDLILDRLDFRWPQLNKEHIEKMAAYCKEVGFL
jgi:thioester reductase-like protein